MVICVCELGNSASCPVVEEFGSFSMDLFTTESDLDLSINFRNSPLVFPRDQKIKTLRKFARKFYSLQSKLLPLLVFAFFIIKFSVIRSGYQLQKLSINVSLRSEN